jgi:hypothetical protein
MFGTEIGRHAELAWMFGTEIDRHAELAWMFGTEIGRHADLAWMFGTEKLLLLGFEPWFVWFIYRSVYWTVLRGLYERSILD